MRGMDRPAGYRGLGYGLAAGALVGGAIASSAYYGGGYYGDLHATRPSRPTAMAAATDTGLCRRQLLPALWRLRAAHYGW